MNFQLSHRMVKHNFENAFSSLSLHVLTNSFIGLNKILVLFYSFYLKDFFIIFSFSKIKTKIVSYTFYFLNY